MNRKRYIDLASGAAGATVDATLSGAHNNSTTTLTFTAALTHANGTAVPTLTGSEHFMLSILDPNGFVSEIVKVTAYASGGTSATVVRGQGGTAAVAHADGAVVINAPTIRDYAPTDFAMVRITTSGDLQVQNSAVTSLAAAAPLNTAAALDLVLAADVDDVIEVGINAYHAATAILVCLDVYTMVGGAQVNPFGAGLVGGSATLVGIPGWLGSGASSTAVPIGSPVFRKLVSGDLSSGTVTLRPYSAKNNGTARGMSATANAPLTFWARNLGPIG